MRIFTGSPYPFKGDQAFFDRDSGLLSRGFQALGIESNAITLGPSFPDELPSIIHGTWQEMEDPKWWSNFSLDGLVIITWGDGKFHKIVLAAKKAGIRVAQMTDTQGNHSPIADLFAHIQAEKAHYWYQPHWKQIARTLLKLPITLTARIIYRDLRDARAIASSDFFLVSTPQATERYRRFVRRLLGKEASHRVRFIPFPVNFHFYYSPEIEKQEEVIAVGRWDSVQKRTPLLMGAISVALSYRPFIRFRIFGIITPELKKWQQGLPLNLRGQVILEGIVPNCTVAEAYKRARVILVSAAYEGCHNASAEAVCSGATVVGCRSPFLGAIEWHTEKIPGRLAERPEPDSLAKALLEELAAWDKGEREPETISRSWVAELHADKVAERICELFEVTPANCKL